MSKRSVMVVVVGMLGMGTWLMAQPMPKANPTERTPGQFFQRFGQRLDRLKQLKEQLGITAEQKTSLQQIREKYSTTLRPMIEKRIEEQRALRELARADKPDEASIRQAAEQIGKTMGDLAVASLPMIAEIKAVLTPQQMDTLEQFRTERESRVDQFLSGELTD
ncbi:MAG: hypothetical protein HJJLKODD_01641 [Phycisphaerae bacterium]|nr:hypothetical protein [Phycisphaerae bacterium]